VNVPLDTHPLFWLISMPSDVDPAAMAVLADPSTDLWVTAASAWEIAIKTRLGRLDGDALLSAWTDIMRDMSTTDLPTIRRHSGRPTPMGSQRSLRSCHRAQALRRNLIIATRGTATIKAALTPTLQA
jgi:PIN domain nuclease of toxin-antitoxin system